MVLLVENKTKQEQSQSFSVATQLRHSSWETTAADQVPNLLSGKHSYHRTDTWQYCCILEGKALPGMLNPRTHHRARGCELQFPARSSEKMGSRLHSSFLGAAEVAPCRARGELWTAGRPRNWHLRSVRHRPVTNQLLPRLGWRQISSQLFIEELSSKISYLRQGSSETEQVVSLATVKNVVFAAQGLVTTVTSITGEHETQNKSTATRCWLVPKLWGLCFVYF